MCLNVRTIVNPSKHLSPLASRFYLNVACGHCAECRKVRELEWQHRAYHEYKHYSEQGFVLFDTLTYDEVNVPRIISIHGHRLREPFRCFSPLHIKVFLSTLRDNIRRYSVTHHDGSVTKPFEDLFTSDNFKYLITSEYGGTTHRPHYHCLFFCKIAGLNPYLLNMLIRRSWPHGFCDNSTVKKRLVNGTGVLTYVSKYMCKDDEFTTQLHNILGDYILSRQEVNMIYPFHRLSKGFGLHLFDFIPRFTLYYDGTISMPDKDNLLSTIPLPMYYQRHMYYDLVDDSHNIDPISGKPRKRWRLNTLGVSYKMYHLDKSIDKYVTTLTDKLEAYKHSSGIEFDIDLPDGITLRDYAIYKLIYQGSVGRFVGDYKLAYRMLLTSDGALIRDKHKVTYLPMSRKVGDITYDHNSFKTLDCLIEIVDKHLNNYKIARYRDIGRTRKMFKSLNESKILIPLFNNRLSFVNTTNVSSYLIKIS
ncbi:replication initiator protein [Microvirus sp.]|nr:replication initiator protein [Microvirus sp.]